MLAKSREEGGSVKNIGPPIMSNGDSVVLAENTVIDKTTYNQHETGCHIVYYSTFYTSQTIQYCTYYSNIYIYIAYLNM